MIKSKQFKIVGARIWISNLSDLNDLPRGYTYDLSSRKDEGGGFISYLVTGKVTQSVEPELKEYWVADEHLLDEKPSPPNGSYVKVWGLA